METVLRLKTFMGRPLKVIVEDDGDVTFDVTGDSDFIVTSDVFDRITRARQDLLVTVAAHAKFASGT